MAIDKITASLSTKTIMGTMLVPSVFEYFFRFNLFRFTLFRVLFSYSKIRINLKLPEKGDKCPCPVTILGACDILFHFYACHCLADDDRARPVMSVMNINIINTGLAGAILAPALWMYLAAIATICIGDVRHPASLFANGTLWRRPVLLLGFVLPLPRPVFRAMLLFVGILGCL